MTPRQTSLFVLKFALLAAALALPVAGCNSSGGCSRDADCKGDRVCLRGDCADPPPGFSKPSQAQATPPAGEEAPPARGGHAQAPATPSPAAPVGPRSYKLTIVSANLAPSKPDGTAWDADNSAPDCVVTISVRGAGKGTVQTTKAQNNTSPAWNQQGTVTINRGDTLAVSIVDKDAISDDPIASWSSVFNGPGRQTLQDVSHGVNALVFDIAAVE